MTELAPPGGSSPPPRVVIVEDDADMLDLLDLMFRELARWDVHSFRSGAVFLDEIVQLAPIDLLLVDLRMEPVSGPRILAEIAARGKRSFPALYLTGMRPSESDLQLADGFVMKPFTFDELMVSLRRFVPGAYAI
jgi:CheY-like chemotaxis protein